MAKLFLLTKIQLLGLFGINKLLHARTFKARLHTAGLGIIAIMLSAMLGSFSYTAAASYAAIGLADLIPAAGLMLLSVVTIFFTLFRSSGILFGFSDYDMIMALPIPRYAIIISRLLTVYLGNLVFGGLVLLPAMAVFMQASASPAIIWVSVLIVWLLAPLLPMMVSMTLGVFISAISTRFRHKNLVVTLLSFGAAIGSMVLSFSAQSMDIDLLADLSTQLGHAIVRSYPPAALITAALCNRSAAALAAFALLSVTVAALFVFLLSKVYTKINAALTAHHTSAAYRITTLSTLSVNKALYQRERKLLTSSPVYLLNTCIGAVFMIISALSVAVFGKEQLTDMLDLPALQQTLPSIMPFFSAAFIIMSSTTAASVSMEGKTRWILSSLPVSSKAIFSSKILVNLAVLLPPTIFTGITLCISFPLPPLSMLMVFVTPTVYAAFIAVIGLCINLKFPKFDWTNPQQAVKQSGAVVLTMLAGFAALIVPVLLIFGFSQQGHFIVAASTLGLAAITLALYQRLIRANISKFLS